MHSGKRVNLTVRPAPANHGIKFRRVDLPNRPEVNAHFNNVVDTSLATVLGSDGFIVSTIEHLMATFSGLSIDNAMVEIDAYELPIMDGSAAPFASLIMSAGILTQRHPRWFFIVKEPIEYINGERSVCIYPSDTFKITYTIEYQHPMIKTQTLSVELTESVFQKDVSYARTYGFLHEIEYLKQFGFARGGSLDNAVVIAEKEILNNEGLRYPDEFVRHKILDCIGDFSLLGMPLVGHVVAHKAGHAFNHGFLEKFFAEKQCWETRTFLDSFQGTDISPKSLAI